MVKNKMLAVYMAAKTRQGIHTIAAAL